MKISLSWLKEFIGIHISPEEVSEILTDIGLEVEKMAEVETIPGGLKGLVIGEVLTKEKHPDADRLNITTVNVGTDEPYQIVCGAPNVEAGQKVVAALPGTTLYPTNGDTFKIKSSKIRGVVSNGMLCAQDEIGIGTSHDGIMILDQDAKVGLEASKFFNLESDIVYEIGLTPNRADAMSHFGVARDLMAAFKHKGILDKTSKQCKHSIEDFKVNNNDLVVEVEVQNPEACVRYAGLTISGVDVKDSPEWIQNRLRSIGLSPINNIVDATNYVLHELGQPLHAFDADVVGKKVVVRNAKQGEKFVTLDEMERELDQNDLMICNDTSPMCIAGVFGGVKSGVTESTTSIFLESAYFDPVSVRKTAKRHALNTDASFRFERGIDPNITIDALKRAALLIQEVAGGNITSDIVEFKSGEIKNYEFDVDLSRINRLIGVNVDKDVALDILESLDIKVLSDNGKILSLEVPSYRVDVTREADVAEEILRIYGFNNVPIPEKLNSSVTSRPSLDKEKVQNFASDYLSGRGLYEAMSNSLTKSDYLNIKESKGVNERFNVSMLNPLSRDLDIMRQTLLFGALEAVKLNQNHGNSDIKLFEFGKTYKKFETGYEETEYLSIALSGRKEEDSWNSANQSVSFYSLKSLVEGLLERLGVLKNYKVSGNINELLEDGLTYKIANKNVVNISWVGLKLKKSFGIKSDVYYAEINWTALLDLLKMNRVKFSELAKYPAVKRDFSLLIDKSVKFEDLAVVARNSDKKILKQVSLFDVYEGDKLPEGKKSYALRFVLQDENQTLSDKVIDKVMNKIQQQFEKQFNAELR